MSNRNSNKRGKIRIDRLLVDRGLVESRERGQAMIIAGQVLANGQKQDKVGALVPDDAEIRILGEQHPYVSRGGLKLEAALRGFKVSVDGKTALDVGASTGGFTDCLIQHGCSMVYAVDVGYGQMAWKLRQDPRVVVIERTNIRTMDASLIHAPVDIAVIDASFISLEKVIPAIMHFLKPGSELIALIKPQFEVGKGQVGKGGIVRDEGQRAAVVDKVKALFIEAGFSVEGVDRSPITGQEGNVEFLIYAIYRS
jgi:23S rRNA (cytidine1920-2'-O)/16S rRNA (cytidine1409-2'-O)-methyltransferase